MLGCSCDTCTSDDPKDKRLRSSAIVSYGDTNLLVDTGPDLRTQLLRQGTSHIDAILLTHEHNDHTAGIDDIRPYNFKRDDDIPLYAESRVLDNLKVRYSYIFNKSYSTAAKLAPIIVEPGVAFTLSDQEILPVRIMHGGLPIIGYRFGDIAYLTDVKSVPHDSLQLLHGIKTLIVNALEPRLHPTHFNIEEAVQLANTLAVEHTYLIHVSHRMGRHQERQLSLPPNVSLAYDTVVISS